MFGVSRAKQLELVSVLRVARGSRQLLLSCSKAEPPTAPGRGLRLFRKRDGGEARQTVSCLLRLGPEVLAAVSAQVAHGESAPSAGDVQEEVAGRLRLFSAPCVDCPLRPEGASPEATLEQVNSILGVKAGADQGDADASEAEETPDSRAKVSWQIVPAAAAKAGRKVANESELSRRDFFTLFAGGEERPESEELLAGEAPTLDRAALLAAAPDTRFPHPTAVRGGCDGCRICTRVCETRALRWEDVDGEGEDDRVGRLFVDPKKCVACGVCVEECPKGVLELSGARSEGELQVLSIRHARCSECRAELGPGETGVCNRCKARGDILSDLWEQVK